MYKRQGPNGQPTTKVEVRLKFTDVGAKKFADITRRLFQFYNASQSVDRNRFAIVLDKQVISAPVSYTHLDVYKRQLYGFADADGRSVFETVQTVSGVGPRLALAMLAVHSPDGIRAAIVGGDVPALMKVPGIGCLLYTSRCV